MDKGATKESFEEINELKKEITFYRSILDYTYDWEYLVDNNGNMLYVSPSCERITGFSPRLFIEDNKLLEKIILKEDRPIVSKHIKEELKTKDSYSFDFRIMSKDGKEKWIEHKCQPVYDEKSNLIGRRASNRDITEGKYRSLYLLMNEGMALHQIIFDNKNNPIDYLILDVNPSFEKITGLEREKIIGKKASEIYGAGKAPYIDVYYKVANTGTPTKFEVDYEPMQKSFSISVFSPEKNKFVTVFEDITKRKKAEESLKKIEWLLTKGIKSEKIKEDEAQPYGDLTELNSNRLILDSVGKDTLSSIAGDYLDLLDTSSAIYEKNGDYAFGIFSSGWCKLLDKTSRELCGTKDNREALAGGKWHCHESCWNSAAKVSIETGKPVDIECSGGIRLYAVPIFAKNQIIGSINFGYSDPPKDLDKINEISDRYHLGIEELVVEANKYETRPKFIIDIAKRRLLASAKLIGEIVERKIYEEELLNSERTLRTLFDTAPIGICLLKDRRFKWLNNKMTEILGYTQEELIGQNTRVLYDNDEEYERVGKLLYPSNYEFKFVDVESTLKRKDGALIKCYTSISPLDPKDYSKGFITTLTDITQRKKIEAEIKNLANFPSENPNPILRASFDGTLIYANIGSSYLLSFWNAELGKKLPNEIIEIIKKSISLKNNIRKDISIKDKTFFIDFVPIFDGKYVNLYGKDITDRKKVEENLKENEKKYRELFNNMSTCVAIYEAANQGEDFIFKDLNRAGEEKSKVKIDEIKGKSVLEIFPSVKQMGLFDIFKIVYSTGKPQYHPTTLYKDNRISEWVENYVYKLPSGEVVAMYDDVSERKIAQEELIKYKNHLEDLVAERTTRLEIINKELEAFSYSVSHDLRAPLRAIDGFGQALSEEYSDKLGEEGQHYLIRIRNATIKMGNLIDDMLKLSRISRTVIKREKVNLSNLVEEITNELIKSDPARKVNFSIQKDAIVNGDSNLLKIMLENLLNNAWKFTSKKDKATIEFGIISKGTKNIYYIKDNGVGFDIEYADKLFTPFHRLHSEEDFPGTGVGLANVKRIISIHGGEIWAEGKVGQGAVFYFII